MFDPLLPADLLESIVERLRAAEPDAEAVVICGSFGRGEADAYSDADIVVLTRAKPQREERVWLEPRPGTRPLQVSVGAETLEEFLEGDDEPAAWALGFAVCERIRVLWATPAARARLGEDPGYRWPAAPPELGDFVELVMKVRRSREKGDALQLRWAARILAEFGAGLLRPFNKVGVVATPLEALSVAMDLQDAPPGWREDFRTCVGLTPASDEELARAAARLGVGVLAFLRQRVEGQAFPEDDIGAALLDGSLLAYVES